jgi:protein TonB
MRAVMLPISIAVHVLAAIAALVVPLTAEVEWPAPAPLHALTVTALIAVPQTVAAQAPARHSLPMPSQAPHASDLPALPNDTAPTVLLPDETAGAPGPAAPIDSMVPVGLGTPVAAPTQIVESGPAPARSPMRVGQGVREPKKIFDVAPVYPEIALRARVQGAVILEAVINERGTVERIKVLRSVTLLDAAAVDAVSRWRYTPTLLNGTPVAVLMSITINFTLNP